MKMHEELARTKFVERFGKEPEIMAFAPGRINLIGEHTDYSDGFVFPAAIKEGIWVCARANGQNSSRLVSSEKGDGEPFDASSVDPLAELKGWSKYPAAVAWALRQKHHLVAANIDAVVTSNLPIGAGVSSSAALEVAFGLIWNLLGSGSLSSKDIALNGQYAENEFVQVRSGCMDQLASALGQRGHALFIDIRSLEITPVAIPESVCFVLCDTKASRSLASTHYNTRREEVEQACAWLGVKALRDATLQMLPPLKEEDESVYLRAKHVITENERCVKFLEETRKGDMIAAGKLMYQSHNSLSEWFFVSCTELNQMVDSAHRSPYCLGARMMGGGFGGSAIAMVYREHADVFIESTSKGYLSRARKRGGFTICTLGDGASVHRH